MLDVFYVKFSNRTCDVPLSLKKIKKQTLERKFDLNRSQYTSWKGNLKNHWRKCFLADMKYSKIYKFVKDPDDFQKVKDVIEKNFTEIYEQYVFG